jgi:hypothetical protein
MARQELERNFKEISRNSFGITYIAGTIALEGAVMDLHFGTTFGKNGTALEVACGPPGIAATF